MSLPADGKCPHCRQPLIELAASLEFPYSVVHAGTYDDLCAENRAEAKRVIAALVARESSARPEPE